MLVTGVLITTVTVLSVVSFDGITINGGSGGWETGNGRRGKENRKREIDFGWCGVGNINA